MNRCAIILKSCDRELTVDLIVEPLSKTVHLRVEMVDTQLLTELIQGQLLEKVNGLLRTEGEAQLKSLDDNGYKVWLHIINRRVDIGIEVCEATLAVEMQKDTLIIRPLERPRYD